MCLVALSLVPVSAVAQTQTFAIQAPDGTVGISGPLAGQLPARDAQPLKTGTSRIRGRVVATEGGEALRRATVRLQSPEIREGRSTMTDEQGRYEFIDLPAGRYTVSASKNGYLLINFGQRRPNEPGRPLELADKQVAEKVDFALPRGGVIVGRVLDEFGDPVANAMVQPIMMRLVNGERRPMPSGSMATTPDTGEFRLWGLQPGDYLVLANSRTMGNPFDQTNDRTGYPPTYYPGTANVAEAQPIPVAVGQTAGGVDILLRSTRSVRISGTTQTSKGQPLRGGMVMVTPRSSPGVMVGGMMNGMIRPDGSFVISGVTPGEYNLRANGMSAAGETPEILTATVTVGGDDVDGVVLAATPPIKVTGRITLDPPTNWLQPDKIRVMVMPKDPSSGVFFGPSGPPIVHDDFTFEVPANPNSGSMMIRVTPVVPSPVAATWSVKSIRLDTADIIDSGLDVTPGRDVSDVEIVLTNRVQVVSGLVTDARGQAAQDSTILIFAQDAEQRKQARFTGIGKLDQNGRYSVGNLPPGEYFAIALDYADPNRRGGDLSYYEMLSHDAVRFTLSEGEKRNLDLKVVPGR
jgi:hypothetical protein